MTRKKYEGYIFDLDGTIYRGRRPIRAAIDFVKRLQEEQIPYLFLTNNSSKTPLEIVEILDDFGLQVAAETICTSSIILAEYLRHDLKSVRATKKSPTIWIVGERGLREALAPLDLPLNAEDPDYVVMGIDREINYEKLQIASMAVRNGAKFIATNLDRILPTDRGLLPGNGALVSAVITMTGVNPVVVGKPTKQAADQALQLLGMSAEQVLLIGDNYETDIYTGMNAGIDTLLVYTGLTTRAEISEKQYKPTYELDTLEDWIL